MKKQIALTLVASLFTMTAIAQNVTSVSPETKPPCQDLIAIQICKAAEDGQALMGTQGACRDSVMPLLKKNKKAWEKMCKKYAID